MSARIAELHRRKAAALREEAAVEEALAAEIDADTFVEPAPKATASRRRGPRIPRGLKVSELDRARARKLASEAGILRADEEP